MLAPSTQIVSDREAYLGQGRHDVGRRISKDQVELFITADVAGSLQQEFVRHQPEFIAVHDIGTSASLRLLASLAGASGAPVQRLSIRRQGHGVALAVLQFVEVPLAGGTAVRVYSTDLNADAATRTQVARVLLAHSLLGVLMVGELPPHALTGQLMPLHESLLRGPWPNRDLLMVPLGSGTALAGQAAGLAGQSAVRVHVTPHAAKPRQAWNFIGGSWNRLQGGASGERTLRADLSQAVPPPAVPANEAPTEPMGLQPLTPGVIAGRSAAAAPVLAPMPMPVPGASGWPDYAARCAAIKGALSCCVFDTQNQQVMAHAGGAPAAERLALQGAALLEGMHAAARALGLGHARAEAAITVAGHHLLLRPVPGHPGIAVHLVMSSSTGNLTLARMQLERLEAPA